MGKENLTVKRVDHHLLPWRKSEVSFLPLNDDRVSVDEIGVARISQEIKGYLTGVAKLLKGVVVELPNQSRHKIDPLPKSPWKEEPITLGPQEKITFIRARFAKGKTEVIVTNTST